MWLYPPYYSWTSGDLLHLLMLPPPGYDCVHPVQTLDVPFSETLEGRRQTPSLSLEGLPGGLPMLMARRSLAMDENGLEGRRDVSQVRMKGFGMCLRCG
jgi:hypothetical protein